MDEVNVRALAEIVQERASGDDPLVLPEAAIVVAGEAAADADDSVPGTQHLLLGLLHAGAAASVLDRLGVTREKVREANARLFEPATIAGGDGQERRVVGDGEAEQAVTSARRLAARRGQSQFRTERLLFCIALDQVLPPAAS
jgi:ATP-dependent Clp protease ATP-binding subunit ClpA